ncbi:hypothetical protein [Bradyrhizobium sp. AS23.2]|uniref:hypothetical protein n=1 Tax=Bradyrhizobium sp. AS23.2 TaxID=1680155 RepID=UPI00093A29E1|nr:hypothetical protein [Bradyrhizobium sp. AS23.2]OKO75222.1 hypothetical protein AC630_24895 [Bradyrhizobium sp. AS23.2]
MADREQELKDVPHRPPDQSTWPKGIRSISIEETGALGVDAKGELHWYGKPVEIRRPLDLTRRQEAVAVIVAIATVFAAIGAVAQGFAAYNEWACKVGWKAVTCPPADVPSVDEVFPLRGTRAYDQCLVEQRGSTEACDAIMRMRNADERLKKK